MSLSLWIGGGLALAIFWWWSVYWAFVIGCRAGWVSAQDAHNLAMDNVAMKTNPPRKNYPL